MDVSTSRHLLTELRSSARAVLLETPQQWRLTAQGCAKARPSQKPRPALPGQRAGLGLRVAALEQRTALLPAPSLDAVEGPLAVLAAAVGVIRRVVPLLQIPNSGAGKLSHASSSGSTVCWTGSSVHMQVVSGRMCTESRNMYTECGNLPSLHSHLLTSCCATLGCAMPFAGANRAARPPAGRPGAGPARSSCRSPCPFSAAASRRSCPALSAKRICCGRALPYRL